MSEWLDGHCDQLPTALAVLDVLLDPATTDHDVKREILREGHLSYTYVHYETISATLPRPLAISMEEFH